MTDQVDSKPHPSYPHILVSRDGKVVNTKTGREIWYNAAGGRTSHYRVATLGIGTHVSVHRLVWETFIGKVPEGLDVCHKDGDRQNNSLENLYTSTRSLNKLLGPNSHPGKSGYRGVSYDKRRKAFRAQAVIDYKNYSIGHRATAEEAAEARDAWLVERFGIDSIHQGALNFPHHYFRPEELTGDCALSVNNRPLVRAEAKRKVKEGGAA